MSEDQFRKAEERYFVLRGQVETGRITQAQYEASLRELMVQDAQGRHWVLGAETGRWHVHDGTNWVEANPYGGTPSQPPPLPPTNLPEVGRQQPAYAPPPPAQPSRPAGPPPAYGQPYAPPPQRSGGGGKTCGCLITGCLAIVVILVLLGVGGFLAVRSGTITMNTVLNLVGLGPGSVEISNFRDDAIQVSITRLDTTSATPRSPTTLALNAFDVKFYRASEPGKYRVEFRTARGSTNLGTCTLTVRSGDQFQFVTMPERIAVNRANSPSNVGTDFVVTTSSLCR